MSVIATDRADVLLEEAQRTGYRYPEGFLGFVADVEAPGVETSEQVTVHVTADGVTVEGLDAGATWASEQIRSMVAHRLGRPYADGDGRHAKRVIEDGDPLGTRVELEDGMTSSYRVADGQITLVTRQPGQARFSIAIQERLEVSEGVFLPKEFAVFHWDATGALDASEAYSDVYVEVDSLHLPATRRVIRADREGVSTRLLSLSGHALVKGERS